VADLDPAVHLVYASLAVHSSMSMRFRRFSSSLARPMRPRTHGLLLYIEGSFFQVLEGNPDAIDAVYGRIARDPVIRA